MASIVKFNFQLDPYEKDIFFLFCGRRNDRIKGLVWEGDGFLDWLSKTGYFGMERADSQTPTAHVQATANASQTADRKLGEVSVIAGYKDGDVRITLTETVSSSTESFTIGSVYTGYATYEQDTVTTGSGIVVLIMTVNGTNNTGYYDGDYFDSTAYWVKDNGP